MTLPLSPDELLTTTRSVRKRLDLTRPVPYELIEECLRVAQQAPTGSNQQGWQWLVVTDAELRAQIGEYYLRSYTPYAAKRAGDDPARSVERNATQSRVTSSADYLAEVMGQVPVHVIACIEAGEELPAANQAGLWGSLLPAAWSLALALRARGLGTTWTTLHLRYEREVADLLGLPADVRQGVLLPVAYTKGTDFRPGPRVDLDSVLHVNGW
jgi:nitroreductase